MEEICRFTDSDEATVRQLLSEKTRTEQRRETAQKLRDQGLSDFEIASKMGIPHGQVHNLLEPKPGSFRG